MEPGRIESRDETRASELPSRVPLGIPLWGQVTRLNQARRHASIRLSNGREIYMHWSALRGLRFAELRPDQEVECWLEIGSVGLQDAHVRRCRTQPPRRPIAGERSSRE